MYEQANNIWAWNTVHNQLSYISIWVVNRNKIKEKQENNIRPGLSYELIQSTLAYLPFKKEITNMKKGSWLLLKCTLATEEAPVLVHEGLIYASLFCSGEYHIKMTIQIHHLHGNHMKQNQHLNSQHRTLKFFNLNVR